MWLQDRWIRCPSDVCRDSRSPGFYSAYPWELASPHVSTCQRHKLTTVRNPKGTAYKPDHSVSQKTMYALFLFIIEKNFLRGPPTGSPLHFTGCIPISNQFQEMKTSPPLWLLTLTMLPRLLINQASPEYMSREGHLPGPGVGLGESQGGSWHWEDTGNTEEYCGGYHGLKS